MRREVLFACLVVISSGPPTTVRAEAATQTPTQKSEEKSAQTPADAPLSKKLDENKGVIKPPHGVDPEIHKDPPATTGDKMPVIIPPGEPGGDQSVQPK